MSNSFGTVFRVTTWGESHGPALGVVIDGCPAGVIFGEREIADQLSRDIPDTELGTPRGEHNRFQLLSGVFEGKTLGTPISIVIWNNDARPITYSVARETLRPGHADFTYLARFGHTDWRGGSRASGRECIARLAAGAVARSVIESIGVKINGRIIELAGIPITDSDSEKRARNRALEVGEKGDSTGGIAELVIEGLPAGVGRPVFGKLNAEIASALFTIGGVKAVEFGAGLATARQQGSNNNDPFEITPDGQIRTRGNNCGGVLGGISTGDSLTMRLAIKPTPTIAKIQTTVNVATHKSLSMEYKGRFDKNFAPRVVPIAEAMLACVLADHLILSGCIHPCRIETCKPGSKSGSKD